MAEYIEREALLDAVATVAKRLAKSDAQKSLMGRVMYIIDNKPAADVVPVVHGRWEDIGNDWFDLWRCSACGTEWSFSYDPTSTETRVNYCPDCGARMDGEA